MKVLVIGGSGLFGEKLVEFLSTDASFDAEITSTFHTNQLLKQDMDAELDNMVNPVDYIHLDITDEYEVKNVFESVNPDVTLLCSAFTDVDGCEKNKKLAFDVNVSGTKHVAKKVNETGSRLVYVSTDYVFDGQKGNYDESDTTHPINYYGETKLVGEQVVKNSCNDFLICRTSVIYGVNKPNFAWWLIGMLSRGESVRIVTDQFVSATYNLDLTLQILNLIRNSDDVCNHNDSNDSDQIDEHRCVFHTAGGTRVSRFDFAMSLADVFGFDKSLIKKAKMKDFDWSADRPVDSSLDVSRISRFQKPMDVRTALRHFKREYDLKIKQNNNRNELGGIVS